MKKLFLFVFLPIIAIYMFFRAHHDKIKYQTVNDNNLPKNLEVYRILFISDIHRRRIRMKTLGSIKQNIDIVIIGGDLTEKFVPLTRTRKNLLKLKRWNSPICFVWGNNDFEVNTDSFINMLEEENVQILTNKALEIRKGNKTLKFIGLHYPPTDLEIRNNLITDYNTVDYCILLSHLPISYKELTEKEKQYVNLFLSAHTHGGQIRIFDLGPYEKGKFETYGKTSIIISEGYGYSILPFRLATNAECHVITLQNIEAFK